MTEMGRALLLLLLAFEALVTGALTGWARRNAAD
jgi:hypothetical protein